VKENDKVVVESSFVADYNGLTGTVTRVKMHPSDPTMPEMYLIDADSTPENQRLLERIGSPYIDLAKPWTFWFVGQELKLQNA
jgi:hypothetical protein